MTISFSGLASGLDTSSWVESLVALKQAKVKTLEEEKETVLLSQETLNNIKSFFNSFRSVIEKVTDAKFGNATTDLFAQNLATSTNLDVLTASAAPEAEKGTYNILVDKLASETQANSTYSYMTTIIQTTTATNDSKLINLGVKAGNIGVNVNGVERRISITETDTIGTFVEKLKNIGVEASYNEETGVFSVNTDDGAINDIDRTGIVSALHLSGVNEGYTSNSLTVSTTDTVYSAATEATLLKDLGVQAGVITIHANDTNYNITIYNTSTLGSFISDLHSNNIDAELDSTGVFTISDAEITNGGTTDILNALGLAVDIYGKSQITGDLYHSSVVTQTTTATSSTLLKSLGEGISISKGQTVIVKNSNNEYTTITVGTTTTLGGLLEAMSNAGLYAALQNDGTVEIAGGTITGGTFDAISALGLLTEPYSAMVTGNSLTETVEVHQLVTLQTKLVDDLKVSEGYLEVTDADNNKEYLKIYSGQTIADLMTALSNYGLSTSLDEETGVLSITGGAFNTLSDTDVQALVSDGTIRETESRYIKGTNLLECLYGAGTISTEHITVSSTYARSRALTYSVTNTINASLTTTLGNLGLSNGSAVFNVRGESRTITLNNTISIQGLMDALAGQGIGSSWDSDNSRITIENATLVGGTSNLADVLDLTTTVSGKYVTSNELYSKETLTIDATRNTVLKDYGISNTMSAAERTVNLYNSDGTLLASTVVGEGTTIGNLLDWINSSTGVSASLKNGIITLNNGYIENSTLETSMGLTTSNKSSYVLGSIMSVTTTAAVTGETTLGDIISTLGTTTEVSSGYNLVFNSNTLSVSATTTINGLINMIYANGGTAFLDHTGRLSINGGTLSGSVAQALGVTSVTHTSSVSASGETLYTKEEVYADLDTTLSELGISDTSYIIYNSLGQSYKTVNISSTSTLGAFLNGLKSEGIDGTISNGVIKLESAEGKYISGDLATSLGITTQTTTEIVNTTQSSTLAITHTGTVVADESSTLGDIGAITAENQTLNIFNNEQSQIGTITILTSTSTVGDLFAVLKDYGIVGTITNGVISLYSEAGNYVSGDIATNLGIGVESGINKTYTVAQTVTSSDRITYSNNVDATESSKLAEFIPGLSSINVVVYDSSSTSIGTIAIDTSTTIGDFLANLSNYDITGNIEDGVISLTSNVGNYISNTTLKQHLGIDTTSVIVTMTSGATTTSTAQITYTEVIALTGETKLSDVGVNTSGFVQQVTRITADEALAQGYTCVYTASDLVTALADRNANIMLMNDIDLSGISNWNMLGANGSGAYTGIFNGNGYTISNLTIDNSQPETSHAGFFGEAIGAQICNVRFSNITVNNSSTYYSGGCWAGIIAGYLEDSVISNCVVENSTLTGNVSVGGLIAGAIYKCDTQYCYVSGNINTTDDSMVAAGLCAVSTYSQFSFCYSNASIAGGEEGTIAGLLASSVQNTLDNLETWGKLSGGNDALAAIHGTSSDTISNVTYVQSVNPSMIGVNSGNTTGVEGTVSLRSDTPGLFVQSSTGEILGEIKLAENATVDDMLLALAGYGISGTIQDGKIVLNSTNGNYIVGSIATELGIDSVATTATITVGTSATSTAAITYTETVLATDTTRLDQIFKPYVIDGTITSTGVTGTVIGISSAQELEWLANLVNGGDDMSHKTFVLTDNIDLSGYSNWTPIGNTLGTEFCGYFDGQGYTISNLTQSIAVTDTDYNVGGLFGYVEGIISNLKLDAFDIYMESLAVEAYVGALVGCGGAVSIEGVSANNITIRLAGNEINAGGIIGSALSGMDVSNCSTNGYIVNYGSYNNMGGIAGQLRNANNSIQQCHSSMYLQAQADYNGYYGGIVGEILHVGAPYPFSASIMDCSFSGSLSTQDNVQLGVGGIVGALINNSGATALNIANCYAQLQFVGSYEARAILGYADIAGVANITLKDSYGNRSSGAYFQELCYNTPNANYTYDYSIDFNEEEMMSVDRSEFWQLALASGYDTSIWNSDGTVKTVMDNTLMVVDGDDGSAEMLELTPEYISNHTLGDLVSWIELQTGSPVNIIDGVIKIGNTENKYVAGTVAEALGIEIDTSKVKTVGVANTSTAVVTFTTTRAAATTDSLMSLKYGTINGAITSTGVTGTVIGISSAQELEWLADIVNRGNNMSGRTFVLLNDIDMSGITDWTPIGDGDYTNQDFAGTFDGLGHTIRNLTMTSANPSATSSYGRIGLFGLLTGNAKIMNLNLDNFNFSDNTKSAAWGSVGFLAAGTIYGSQYISGVNVTNSTISGCGGGLLGFTGFRSSDSVTIINCSTQFTATAYIDDPSSSGGYIGNLGGIIQFASYNTYIKGCSSSFTADGSYYLAGGIIGRATAQNGANYTIEDCTYKGSITTTRDNIRGISGIIGNYCIVDNDTTSSVTINRVYSDAILNINSANTSHISAAGIIGIARDSGFDITQTNNVVNLTDCYYGANYDAYYLQNSVYATVNSSNVQGMVTGSQMGAYAVARGFDLNLWDSNNGRLKIANEYGIVVSDSNGASLATISLNGTNSIQDMLNELNNYGGADIINGQILFTPSSGNYLSGGFADVYSMTDNLSDELKVSDTDILKEDTLISRNSVIKLISQGVEYTITVPSKKTVGGMLTQLAAYGIEGKVSNDKITLIGNENSYITSMSSSLQNYLKLSNQWSSLKSITTNTDSNTLKIVSTNTAISDTTLDSLQLSGDYYITLKVDGTTQILTINSSQTLGDVFTELAAYGIRSSIQNGQVTFVGTDDAYIEDMTIELDRALKLYGVDKHTTKTETTYANTDSDTLNSSILMSLTTSTHLSDLNVGANGYITLMADGTQYTMTITPDMSIDDLISTLAGYGISGSVQDAQLTLVGRDDNYILSISDNIANALKLTQGNGYTYISTEEIYYQNTDSNYLSSTKTITLTTSSTFADIGLSNESYITVMTNGTEHIVTVTSDKTIDDLISTIAGFGISGSVNDGKLTFAANNGCYIKDMTSGLKDLLKLTLGQGNSWTTIEGATWVNTDSNDLSVAKNDLKLTGDTVLSSINGFNNGNGSLIVHQTNGSYVTISVDASKTLDEFFEQISHYGLVGSIDSSGKVTITGVGNVYLQAASGGSNILTALKLGNLAQNVQTVTVNRTSDTLTHTVTVAASGTTTLENLGDSAGNSIAFDAANKAYIILETYSDAGNTHVTLNFSKTQSIYDVIDTLAEYGINASIDAKGRFSVSSPTLTDFDMSGSLGTFLMGTYDKEYGTDTTYNVTTNLVQKTIVNMDDFSNLSSFGVTNGNILITQQGVTYTVNIDTTSITTIGEFRNLLSRYGFTSSIDNMGRLSVSGIGDSYLSSIEGGSNILELLGLNNWTLGEITQSSSYLTDTEAKINRISMSDKLSALTNASGTNLGITDGQIYVYQDGTRSTLNINTNDTLETLAAKLSQYGITVGISQEGKLYFDGNNNSYLTTDGIATSSASNILSRIGIAGNWSTRYDSTSGNLQYTEDVDNVMTGSTKLSDLQDSSGNNLGITEGSYYVYSNGVRNTETITSDMTVNDFMATMAKYGLIADVAEDGSISVGAYNNTYLATSALSGQNSNIVSTLFAEWDFVNIYTSNGLDVPVDEIRAINRDTKLADINEGSYEDGYITVIKDGVQTNISLSAEDTVGTLMDELALYGFESVINDNGQLIIKNSGDSLLQNYTGSDKKSNVLSLLGIGLNDWISTNTYHSSTLDVVSTSTMNVSATRATLLSELGVSTGEYYIYNNGVKYTAMISSDETVGSLMDTLKNFGLETSLVSGANGAVLSIIGKGDSYVAK